MKLSTQEKIRKILDIVGIHGERVKDDPANGETIRNLRGVAQIRQRQTGPRIDFTILARGVEIQGSKWVSSIKPPKIVRGEERDFERVFRNATRKERKIISELEVEKAERQAAAQNFVPQRRYF